MSKALREKLGAKEKSRLMQWARTNEGNIHSGALTLSLSPEPASDILPSHPTFRLDMQGSFADTNGILWLKLQIQMRDAPLVTVYVHWDGYYKAHIKPGCVLWAVKWSVTKELEHHTINMGEKKIGVEKKGRLSYSIQLR